ncbi:hypothetical protein QYF61_012604, partial [Mycteria americana]
MITLPKVASNHHMAHKSFSVREQEVQRGTFPRWLTHQLRQEVICHTLQEPPRLFPLCCIVFPADIRQGYPTTSPASPIPPEEFIAIHRRTPVVRVIPPCFHDANHIIVFLVYMLQYYYNILRMPRGCLANAKQHLQPVPMLDNPFSEVKFPNIQSKPPLAQLEAISSCPITRYLGEETDPHLSTTSFQTLHQLRCPSLDTLQPLNVSLVVRGPKRNTVFEVRPHQCRVQGHDHFPSPAGHTVFDTSQGAIAFLGHLGTLPAHIQAAVNQHSQVLLCWAAFQPLFPKPVALHGVVVAQVQDLALGLVEPHAIGPSPSIQPVQVPLQSLPTLQQINTPAQLGVVCKLTEGALDPFVQIIDKDIKQDWPQHKALGNTTCDRPPTGVRLSRFGRRLGLLVERLKFESLWIQRLFIFRDAIQSIQGLCQKKQLGASEEGSSLL